MLPRAQLRERFEARGVDERSQVVTSCGSGLTAAVLNLGLASAGLADGRSTMARGRNGARERILPVDV